MAGVNVAVSVGAVSVGANDEESGGWAARAAPAVLSGWDRAIGVSPLVSALAWSASIICCCRCEGSVPRRMASCGTACQSTTEDEADGTPDMWAVSWLLVAEA